MRSLSKILCLAIAFLFCATTVQAAGYRPTFDKDRTVYVDPAAPSNSQLPLDFTGLAAELEQAGKQHNVKYYFVFIEETNDNFNYNTNFALPVLKDILRSWYNEPGFDQDRHILIVHVRKKGTKFGGKTAVEAGQALKKLGLTGSRFDQSGGPVMKAVYDHMRNSDPNHRRFVLAITANCNDELTAAAAASRPSSPSAPSNSGGSASYGDGSGVAAVLLLLVGVAVFVTIIVALMAFGSHRTSEKQELQKRVSARAEKIRSFSASLSEFELGLPAVCLPGYGGDSTGETAAAQIAIRNAVADARAALTLMTAHNQRANATVASAWTLGTARASLSDAIVVDTSTNHGSTKYAVGSAQHPQYLLEAFNLTKAKELDEQYRLRMKEAADMTAALKERDTLKGQYETAGLRLGALQDHEQRIQDSCTTMGVAVTADPVKAARERQPAYKALTEFNELLRKGLRTNTRIPQVDEEVKAARGVAAAARKVQIDLHYPGKRTGSANLSRRTVDVAYHTTENPENCLDEADRKLVEARALLKDGKTKAAEEAVTAASDAVSKFTTQVKAFNANRLAVKRDVVGVEVLVSKLTEEVAAFAQELGNAENTFRQECAEFATMHSEVGRAGVQRDKAVECLARCAEAFAEQRFDLAKRKLDEASAACEAGQSKLAEARKALGGLNEMKAHAELVYGKRDALRAQLAAELPKGTTPETRGMRNSADATLSALVALMTGTVNWRQASAKAKEVETEMARLARAVGEDKTKYDEALAKIEKARKNGCPSSKRDDAQAAADSGNYSSTDAFLVGYMTSSYSSGSSGSSCGSTTSSSSCGTSSCSSGSSCGGGGCGGGGCGGG